MKKGSPDILLDISLSELVETRFTVIPCYIVTIKPET